MVGDTPETVRRNDRPRIADVVWPVREPMLAILLTAGYGCVTHCREGAAQTASDDFGRREHWGAVGCFVLGRNEICRRTNGSDCWGGIS
jgi:hypothetical protein